MLDDIEKFASIATSLPWPMIIALALMIGCAIWYLQVFAPMAEELDKSKALITETLTAIKASLESATLEIVAIKALQEVHRAELVRLSSDVNNKLENANSLLENHARTTTERNRILDNGMLDMKEEIESIKEKLDNLKERMIIINTTLSSRNQNSGAH